MDAMPGTPTSREDCARYDRTDPLAAVRDRFTLPDDVIYLDGNSLGPLPANTAQRVASAIEDEWGRNLIRSWNDAGWFAKPTTVGDRIARLIGAGPGQVVVGDSTSLALFQTVIAAARMRPGRSVIVADREDFPTDLYITEAACEVQGLSRRLIWHGGPQLADVLDDQVAVVVLSQVNYRTGRRQDLAAVTRQVQQAGALIVWDLCHSVGAMEIDLDGAGADFAVGCTYKYLNGGPGSPAFAYCATRHQHEAYPPITGWHGHDRPFDFDTEYVAAQGITRFRVGTPQILSMAALEASLDIWDEVDLAQVRHKSLQLTDLFIRLVETRLPAGEFEIVTPRVPDARGSQVALRRAQDGYPIMAALIERGVIGDFRAPDLLRFGFAPLYTRLTDVWDAVDILADVLASGVWREPRFQRRAAVT